jgi:hypothetical protein
MSIKAVQLQSAIVAALDQQKASFASKSAYAAARKMLQGLGFSDKPDTYDAWENDKGGVMAKKGDHRKEVIDALKKAGYAKEDKWYEKNGAASMQPEFQKRGSAYGFTTVAVL